MAGVNRGGFANAIGPAPNAQASHSLRVMPALYHSLIALPVIRCDSALILASKPWSKSKWTAEDPTAFTWAPDRPGLGWELTVD